MRCLTILAVLALASLSLVEGAVDVTAAGRAIRGWRATSISANRINQTAVIADQHHWLAVIHDNPRRRDAPPNPFDGLNQFNVSEGQFIYEVATLENRRAWISVVTFSGWASQSQYIALVDLNNHNVIANISASEFQPAAKGSEPPFLAVDSMNEMYAVQGNLVWIFNSDGKQVNYYKLMEQSAPIVSIDIASDGTLWILEDYDSKKQANVLAQYTDGGQYLNSYNLNFTLRPENFLIDLAVSKTEAYITAVGVPLILCWDIIKGVHCRDLRIDGGEREREVFADFAPQVTLFNDTILIVVDESLDAAEAYDLNRRAHSFNIFSREATVQGASQLRATRGELLVSLDYEEHADVILVNQREGVLIAEFGRPDRNTRREGIYTAGITVDPRDTVFVSKEFYDVERRIYVNFVDIYEQRRHHLTVNVSSSGQIVFEERTQTIWIADDSQKQPIVNAYAPSNGTLLKSFKFTGFEEEHWITDLQIMPANLTADPKIAWFVASDFESQQLIVESETGVVAGMLSTPNMHPRSFVLDWLTGYTYIAVEDRRNETAGYDSFIAVIDPKGDFVEMLVSPAGWPHAELIAVTIDFEGSVFAISARYGAVLEWRRGRRATTSKVVGKSWFNNQLNLADSIPAVIAASE